MSTSKPPRTDICPIEPKIDESTLTKARHDRLLTDGDAKLLAGPRARLKDLATLARVGCDFAKGFRGLNVVGPCVTVFGSARLLSNDPYYELARGVGSMIAKLGFTVMTGGGPGIMEAANRGATEAGGHSIGCNIKLPFEQKPNVYLDRQVTLDYFFVRKVLLVKYSYAFIVMPGGAGTMDEFFEALTLIQTGKLSNFPIIVMGTEFWKPMRELVNSMLKAGTISESDLELVTVTDSIDEAKEQLRECAIRQYGLQRKSEHLGKPKW
ncbi:MAG: TIGR00730 family Rossman fold protein [Verrucomicrobiaceae bacterium]|nr:TIGR00730 family Rossman fold protein [Verrucomicrobiaceae bacterium]